MLYLASAPTYRADTGFQTRTWNFDGVRTQDVIEPSIDLTLPRQTNLHVRTSFQTENFGGVHLTGILNHFLSVNTRLSALLQGGVDMGTGRRVVRRGVTVPEVGRGRDISVWATLRPTRQVVIEPSLSYEELHLFDGDAVVHAIRRPRIRWARIVSTSRRSVHAETVADRRSKLSGGPRALRRRTVPP